MKIDKYLVSKILAFITGTSTVILFVLSQVKALSASESEMKVFTVIYLLNIVILIPSLLFYIWQSSMKKAKIENNTNISENGINVSTDTVYPILYASKEQLELLKEKNQPVEIKRLLTKNMILNGDTIKVVELNDMRNFVLCEVLNATESTIIVIARKLD